MIALLTFGIALLLALGATIFGWTAVPFVIAGLFLVTLAKLVP
jgi:hypothetical protein